MDGDLLDDLFDLEEKFYDEGYELGTRDGAKAGYNEGTVFAVEKGFEKFQEMGRLYGKGIIWAKRLPGEHGLLLSETTAEPTGDDDNQTTRSSRSLTDSTAPSAGKRDGLKLPNLPENSRLEKHLTAFLSLVDPTTLSMENTEDDVADFDDRLKKAQAKARIIEKIIGERSVTAGREGNRAADAGGNIEDIGPLPPRLTQTS